MAAGITPPTTITDYVREELQKLAYFLVGRMGRPLPETLWHYTTFAGLEGILESKAIFATQHSCLNDSLEYLHLPNLIRAEVRRRAAGCTEAPLTDFYDAADRNLQSLDISATGHFVSCFSEDADDLGQWRGYGGGVCGYSIGFRAEDVLRAIQRRPGTFLVPMQYDPGAHAFLVENIVNWAEVQFMAGIERAGIDYMPWGLELQAELAKYLDIVVSLVKHPKFKFETERRLTTKLVDADRPKLQFRQKSSLLARHLPISLLPEETDELLPIACVMVGPGPAQQVTRIAVGDLLAKYGYDSALAAKSAVSYRVP